MAQSNLYVNLPAMSVAKQNPINVQDGVSFSSVLGMFGRWVRARVGGKYHTLLSGLLMPKIPFFRRLTMVETAILYYMSYRTYLLLKKTGLTLTDVIGWIIPCYRRLLHFLGVKPKVVFKDETSFNNRRTTLESVRDGSEETALSTPKCQVLIGQMRDGIFEAHGCGVRMQTFLVLPDHVYSYANADTGRTFVMGRQKNSKGIEISNKDFITIDTDLIAVELSDTEWSTIGASVQAICHDIVESGSYSAIVGARGLGTLDVLRHDSRVFGRVVYNGTTRGGYSGAPYMVNNRIAGIHQSGGAVNGGYSASYVWVTLNAMLNRKEEDTADWITKVLKENRRIEVDDGWHDLETLRIKIGGKYAIVTREAAAKALGNDWRNMGKRSRRTFNLEEQQNPDSLAVKLTSGVMGNRAADRRDREIYLNNLIDRRSRDYDDNSHLQFESIAPESGEAKSPGASEQSVKSPGQEGTQVLCLTTGFKQLSNMQRKQVLAELQREHSSMNIREGLQKKNKSA